MDSRPLHQQFTPLFEVDTGPLGEPWRRLVLGGRPLAALGDQERSCMTLHASVPSLDLATRNTIHRLSKQNVGRFEFFEFYP